MDSPTQPTNKWAQKKSKQLVAKAKKMEQDNISYREIARQLNVSKHTIKNWLHPKYQTKEHKKHRNRVRQNRRNYKYATDALYRIRQLLSVARRKAVKCGYEPCSTSPEEILSRLTEHCECCKRHISECGNLCIDHWHEPPGAFRAWLCGRCNRAFGFMQDDPKLMRQAATLLESRKNETKSI